MPYLIDTVIPAEFSERREAAREEHLRYLEDRAGVILAAGAKLREEGGVGPGSFYLVALDTRAEADAFLAGDPYFRSGLITSSTVTKVRTGFFDRKRMGASA
jgi:uncharacterized protein YciI